MTAPWDLLHVITKLELGGAQRVAMYQVEHSRFVTGERHLAFGPGGLLDAEAERLPGVVTHRLGALGRHVSPLDDARAVAEVATLVRALKARRPGARLLVHTHSSKAGVVGRLGAALAGADRIVHTIHGFGHNHQGRGPLRWALTAAERLAAHACDGLIAVTLANICEGERDRLLADRPARVVRAGIELDAFVRPARPRAEVRAALGIAEDAVVVLTVACLKPQKDPATWAEVGRRVTAEVPGAVFLLAGDGDLRPSTEAFIFEHGLGRRLRLLGWRDDVPDLLHASDVFFLPSLWEGLPQVVVQAMAARLPVVATAVDGTPEAVRDGETGYLVAPGDAKGMAAILVRLALSPEERRCLGERGSEMVDPFSAEQMMRDLDAFYAELAARRPRRLLARARSQ